MTSNRLPNRTNSEICQTKGPCSESPKNCVMFGCFIVVNILISRMNFLWKSSLLQSLSRLKRLHATLHFGEDLLLPADLLLAVFESTLRKRFMVSDALYTLPSEPIPAKRISSI